MITFTRIRALDLATPSAAGRPLHLSAASGLVCLDSRIYVVADDELHLGVFGEANCEPGNLIRLFDGTLPNKPKPRKKQKPDLEALTLLPPFGDYTHGALLALSSGSRDNRRMGAMLGLDARGGVRGAPQIVDLSALLEPLDEWFTSPNIEGAIVCGDELRLLQRRNKQGVNAVVRYELSAVLDGLQSDRALAIKPHTIHPFDLGQIDGIPFGFTDAAALPDGGMVFTAVAENTDDAYLDGVCAGAAIGSADKDGRLRWLRRLDQPHKIEGIDARQEGDVLRLLLVTDADDAGIAASLYAATIGL